MNKPNWKKISHFEGPKESPGFLLWQVSTEWRRLIEASLTTLGLTHAQFVLLASIGWLTQEGKEITQADLARHCKTDINMTSQVLRSLEKKKYIERKKQEGNEKAKFPTLTKKGADLVELAIPLVEKVDGEFFKAIDEEKCVQLLKKLSK